MSYLTLDIGGSAIKYAVIDNSLSMTHKNKAPAPINNLNQMIQTIVDLYHQYNDVEGIAISMPGIINSKEGIAITGGAYTYIDHTPLVDLLNKQIDVPIFIGNDAKCAAVAEMELGILKNVDDAIMIVLGTGIGGAIIIDGHLHQGKRFSSGEFSGIRINGSTHLPIEDEWTLVNGIQGLLMFVQKELETKENYSGYEIFEMANKGNEKVLKALDQFCDKLACQIMNL